MLQVLVNVSRPMRVALAANAQKHQCLCGTPPSLSLSARLQAMKQVYHKTKQDLTKDTSAMDGPEDQRLDTNLLIERTSDRRLGPYWTRDVGRSVLLSAIWTSSWTIIIIEWLDGSQSGCKWSRWS